MKYIDPTYDEGFKFLFGRENVSEELLIPLLNSIFADDPYFKDIVCIKYLNNEHPHERESGKAVRYDIMCQTSEGHRFIVEMQKTWQKTSSQGPSTTYPVRLPSRVTEDIRRMTRYGNMT